MAEKCIRSTSPVMKEESLVVSGVEGIEGQLIPLPNRAEITILQRFEIAFRLV
jgi:hypothetical protein